MDSLPVVPAKHADFVSYVQAHPEIPIQNLVHPYNKFDAAARRIYAQELSHPLVKDNHVNIVPLYDTAGSTDLRVRARDLASEDPEIKEKYILPLEDRTRRPNDSPAVVPTLTEFQQNFAIFTENSLSELDWSNVVVAGSAVVTSALPVPEEHRSSKRALRQYYHDQFAPASDVDLFLYGLTEDQAIEKIKHIEDKIRNSILHETTTVRTKNTVTIVSQYPTRHVQIVLRIYHSVAEILTGFDVDCSCAAYDGKQVYASPRAIASYITQVNQIDLTRRSPSYENRLSKYSHRGFEVFWPQLDRSKIDPTIFERSFNRTQGLARLLVLEKLPKPGDRESYLGKRRSERGRPAPSLNLNRHRRELRGNIKNEWEDEVPEWQEEDQLSNYHTFTIPYGKRFNARSIEKLLYAKDLLLNAQWNQPKDRTVYLHRHPAFFGDADNVIGDCCGCCPRPVTDEELKLAEEESKIYISGPVTFMKDDPGRQEIGSFNPITEVDWTEMAYVGRTERLCQAIVSNDVAAVKSFLADKDANPDRRDYTGRTPLHLACISSSPEVVQCLVDHGARLVARMADGKTALHLGAARGDVGIIRILLTKSHENEEAEAKNKDSKKKITEKESNIGEGGGDVEMSDAYAASHTSASYVMVEEEGSGDNHETLEEIEQEPDIYDINATAWDSLASPLHLAILHGHTEVVTELVSSFGADISMPVKILNDWSRKPEAAILNLVLVLALPLDKARSMSQTLLRLGASPAQADLTQSTPLHYIAQSNYSDLLKIYLENDGPALQRAINHIALTSQSFFRGNNIFFTPLMNAIASRNSTSAKELLKLDAKPWFELEHLMRAIASQASNDHNFQSVLLNAQNGTTQPILFAAEKDLPLIAIELLRQGADPNFEQASTNPYNTWHKNQMTVLTCVRNSLKSKRDYLNGVSGGNQSFQPWDLPTVFEKDDESYLAKYPQKSYRMFFAKNQLKHAREKQKKYDETHSSHQHMVGEQKNTTIEPGLREKKEAVAALIRDYELLEKELLARGAKTVEELYPAENAAFQSRHPTSTSPYKPKIFTINFEFQTPVLTDIRREGYVKLFEAAWAGDIKTIEALTLAMWGPSQDQPPLEIAIQDALSNSCLSIAVLRGHSANAEAIISILQAQYKKKEPQGQVVYEVHSDAESIDEEEINISSHTVDDRFTHENVGEVLTHVESEISPLKALQRSCGALRFLDEFSQPNLRKYGPDNHTSLNFQIGTLLNYAIFKNDISLVEFLIKLGEKCARTDPSGKAKFTIPQEDFQIAIALGHIDCLVKMIQAKATGLPLVQMCELSGIKPKEEHLYYPGLSIRGKKHKEWADAGRVQEMPPPGSRPPLLIAAIQGSLTSTEWFLGTAPGRHYVDYVNSHSEEENIKRLSLSKLGLEGSILNWLQTRNNLVLHCAVMSRPCEESKRLVQYLVDHHPECLEVRSSGGHTPLALACSLHRKSYARILIAAGANQTVRDSESRNLIHLLLISIEEKACETAERLAPLLDLLDKPLVSPMLMQRAEEESITPLGSWLRSNYSNNTWDPRHDDFEKTRDRMADMTKLLMSFDESSNQKQLDILDGSGNTAVHIAVKFGYPGVLEAMLDRRPDLLYRESATGCTPLELAVDSWINAKTRTAPRLSSNPHEKVPEWESVVSRPPRYFIEGHDLRTRWEMMYQICQDRAQQRPGKRRLVTLFEANEVAKRLTVQSNWTKRFAPGGRNYVPGPGAVSEERDEVAIWSRVASEHR
ncbi:hypothetical protein N7466_002413 [Penicillium verhagenii]|uniref:uncharacterized protein n=1 Tax=Penicillium verhagenii TaxID=1562060 RepID=UPI002544FBB2|nr:uncharacterized protein N7466_002413 [Penicillium verhagenii]KAJ5939279.1 hypothetical protein N7466_002413 [Penicillium verhagenii]